MVGKEEQECRVGVGGMGREKEKKKSEVNNAGSL